MKKTTIFLLAIGGAISIRAQSISPRTLNAAGGTAVIGGNEFEWSVGEMTLVSTFSGSSVIVTQGVLQPYDATSTQVTEQRLLKNLQVFPNPASTVVNLQYASSDMGSLSYRLLDMTGKEITSAVIDVKQGTATGQFSVAGLACANYMLEVTVNTAGTTERASYKIQKIK